MYCVSVNAFRSGDDEDVVCCATSLPLKISTALDYLAAAIGGDLPETLHISSFPIKWVSIAPGVVDMGGGDGLRMGAKPDKTFLAKKRKKTMTLEEMLEELLSGEGVGEDEDEDRNEGEDTHDVDEEAMQQDDEDEGGGLSDHDNLVHVGELEQLGGIAAKHRRLGAGGADLILKIVGGL
eukprot:7960150-Pyramimonas_sp.AAC.1